MAVQPAQDEISEWYWWAACSLIEHKPDQIDTEGHRSLLSGANCPTRRPTNSASGEGWVNDKNVLRPSRSSKPEPKLHRLFIEASLWMRRAPERRPGWESRDNSSQWISWLSQRWRSTTRFVFIHSQLTPRKLTLRLFLVEIGAIEPRFGAQQKIRCPLGGQEKWFNRRN